MQRLRASPRARSDAGSWCRRRPAAFPLKPCVPQATDPPRPSSSKRRSAPLRSRSCRPCRSTIDSMVLTLRSGTRRSARSTAPMAPNAFWWQCPCRSASAAIGFSFRSRRPASASLERNSSNRKEFFASASVPGSSTLYSSRSVNRHEGSSPTTGTPCASHGPSAFSTRFASTLASSTSPAERKVRPQHSGPAAFARLRDMHSVAASLQDPDRGAHVLGLEVAVERVDEKHHFALAALRPAPGR